MTRHRLPALLARVLPGCRAQVRQPAEWTVMMRLNGDNSLQQALVSEFPIEFVEKEAWSDLLHAYYAALGQ